MPGSRTRGRGTAAPGRLWMSLLLAGGLCASAAQAGDLPRAEAGNVARMTALSIRIAHAEGNAGKARKYMSLARQQRAGKRLPAPPAAKANPGTRASRPGRTP